MGSEDEVPSPPKDGGQEAEPKTPGKVCVECGKTYPVRRFSRQKIHKERHGTPLDQVFSDVCLACANKDEFDKIKEKALKSSEVKKIEKEARKRAAAEARYKANREEYVKVEAKVMRERVRAREAVNKYNEKLKAADRELAFRVLAKRKLIHYIKRFKPDYDAGWVHHDICRRLEKFVEDVEQGLSPRLMLFMPPRHGKSLIASDMFPSWMLGKHPEWEIISASYAVSLPIGFSRNVRERLRDPSYRALFPHTTLDPESKSAEAWKTTKKGGFIAAGVGGGITGKGCHIGIIDDPVKDAEEADSETMRQKVWDWYGSTFYTRVAPGGGILVIQTRWHDDDLSGRLVAQMKEALKEGVPPEEIDRWEIVEYPAIAVEDEWLNKDGSIGPEPLSEEAYPLRSKGDALHEGRFDINRLKKIKRSLQPRHWSALYQQNPVPDEGVYFTKDMFRYMSEPPSLNSMKLYCAWDLAIGEKQQNDWTVGVVGGLDYNDQVFILDVIRFRGDSYKIVEAILDTYQKYKPEMVGIEKGQLEQAIRPILRKRMAERRIYPVFAEGDRALVPITDKMTRARPLQGRMQQGMVYFLEQPWLEGLRHELLRFPGGVHDDMVDAMAWLMRMLMNEQPPRKPKHLTKKSWKDNLSQYMRSGPRSGDHMAA